MRVMVRRENPEGPPDFGALVGPMDPLPLVGDFYGPTDIEAEALHVKRGALLKVLGRIFFKEGDPPRIWTCVLRTS